MIKKSEAFLLISYPYKTTSMITHFLTPEAIVQTLSYGAKKENVNFGSDLNSVSKLDIVYYINNTKGLNTLKETSIIKNYSNVEHDNNSLSALYYIKEMIFNVAKDFDERYFALLEKLLDALSNNIDENKNDENKMTEYIKLLLRAFEIKILHIIGISPQLSNCIYCDTNNFDNYTFSIADSSIVCRNCLSNIASITDTYNLNKEEIEFLKIIKHSTFADVLKIDVYKYKNMINGISREILSKLLFNHTGRVLKSEAIINEILSA